jgi:phosphoribosyl-ATP pyrophosphohydrolase
MNIDTLNQLMNVLKDRKNADPEGSYVAGLYQKGARQIAKKIGEEATELVIESVRLEAKPESDKRRARVVSESADLLFHLLILLENHNIPLADILQELARREGVSGLVVKASRPPDR